MSQKKVPVAIPIFHQPIIETHCHLDYLTGDLQQTLKDAKAIGVERIVTIAVTPDNLAKVRDLTTQDAMIYGTQGVHPQDAQHFSTETAAELRRTPAYERLVAIGEIGLDYHYDHCDRAVQRQVFEEQLRIAIELDLPVVIHTRDADADTQAILAELAPQLKRKGVIHSFTSSMALAEFCLAEGFMLGFNGIITFNKAENVREVLSITPLERILLETDAPYLTPVPYRGRENAPKYLPFIAQKIAEVKAIPVEQVLEQTYQNAKQLFGFS